MRPLFRRRNQTGARLSDIRQWGAPHFRNIGKRSWATPAISPPGLLLVIVIEHMNQEEPYVEGITDLY